MRFLPAGKGRRKRGRVQYSTKPSLQRRPGNCPKPSYKPYMYVRDRGVEVSRLRSLNDKTTIECTPICSTVKNTFVFHVIIYNIHAVNI